MFTGIVRELLTITKLQSTNGVLQVSLTLPKWANLGRKLEVGESILLHGICTTVVSFDDTQFMTELMPETLQKTNAGSWVVGQAIHAEPSLTLQTLLSGSLVYGHVDGTTQVVTVDAHPGETIVRLALSPFMKGYVFNKSGITINGANLTIVDARIDSFTVHLIPQTQTLTTLALLKAGDQVNIELDYFTKTIKHLGQDLWQRMQTPPQAQS